jgi:hypothetical protein
MPGEAIKQAPEKPDARYAAQPGTARVKGAPATVIASRAARLGIALRLLEVPVHAESDLRGVPGLDPDTPARLLAQRMKVRIASDERYDLQVEVVPPA